MARWREGDAIGWPSGEKERLLDGPLERRRGYWMALWREGEANGWPAGEKERPDYWDNNLVAKEKFFLSATKSC
jgi:hypothetical protein